MLSLPSSVRIFVCREPTDMRCGRYLLASRAKSHIGKDPLSGHLFLFFNKRRTSVKVLYFDRSGYAVWHKVLEQGSYGSPTKDELVEAELACLLEGIDISLAPRKKRFSLTKSEHS